MLKRFHETLLYISDMKASFEFYDKLGFNPQKSKAGIGLKLGDYSVYLLDENQTPIKNESGLKPKGLGIYSYVEVDDVDAYYAYVLTKGIEPRTQPKTWPWGKREFVVKDPDGYKLVFFSSVKRH
ncbi:MAG: VOC family protein [Candidatus Paceibacterota bacterium]